MLNPLRSVAAIPNHAVGKKREGAGLENRKEGRRSAESFESLAPEETRHDILSSHVRPSAMKILLRARAVGGHTCSHRCCGLAGPKWNCQNVDGEQRHAPFNWIAVPRV